MNKILITGCNGQVGWELQRTLAPLGAIFTFDKQSLDLSSPDQIRHIVRTVQPNIIVNAGAYTAVDKAESSLEICMQVNGLGPGILAEEAKLLNALLVHYSTDYVFDGSAKHAYSEDDMVFPLNVYGQSKLAGENAIQAVGGNYLILRTSWIYATRGKNFLLTMLKLGKERENLKIVNDQIGAPTWSRMIAEATAQILAISSNTPKEDAWGLYNLTCTGQTSWFGFAEAIFKHYSLKHPDIIVPKLLGIPSKEYPTPAQRPANSILSHTKLQNTFNLVLPDWEKALELCMREL